ncbi:hypothetical protein [Microbacterium sp. NPDC090003]
MATKVRSVGCSIAYRSTSLIEPAVTDEAGVTLLRYRRTDRVPSVSPF